MFENRTISMSAGWNGVNLFYIDECVLLGKVFLCKQFCENFRADLLFHQNSCFLKWHPFLNSHLVPLALYCLIALTTNLENVSLKSVFILKKQIFSGALVT